MKLRLFLYKDFLLKKYLINYKLCKYSMFNILFDSNNILNIEYVNISNICYNK